MKNKQKGFLSFAFPFILLTLVFALVLTACGGSEQPAQNNENEENEETVEPSINVSFDENATYQMDADALTEAFDVVYSDKSTSRKSTYSIQSMELTEDGQYIKVVIQAEGMEKTVLLPFAGEQPDIRPELLPIYRLLSKKGDKSATFTISQGVTSGEDQTRSKSFAVKAIINLVGDAYEFALTDVNPNGEKAYVVFKNDTLTVLGRVIPAAQLLDSPASGNGAGEGTSQAPVQSVNSSFIEDLSHALDSLEPMISDLEFLSREDGVYTLSITSQQLINLSPLLSVYGIEIDTLADLLDEKLDGTFKEGKVELTLSLAILESSVELNLLVQNKKSGDEITMNAVLAFADAPVTIPEAIYTLPEILPFSLQDVEITIPFRLPQNKVNTTTKVVLHLSNIFAETEEDYVTAITTDQEGLTLARFVLSKNTLYLDISGLAAQLGNASAAAGYTFYKEIDLDLDPLSLLTLLFTHDASAESLEAQADEADDSYEVYEADETAVTNDDFDELLEPYTDGFAGYLQYLRLDSLAEDGSIRDLYAEVKEIYEENKDLFDAVFVADGNGSMQIVVSASGQPDLFTILNLFVGIPTEDGWQDIDKGMFIAFLQGNNESSFDLSAIFKKITGVELQTFLSDLVIKTTISRDDVVAAFVSLTNVRGAEYFATGFEICQVENGYQFTPTEAELASAQDFSALSNAMLMLLVSIMLK